MNKKIFLLFFIFTQLGFTFDQDLKALHEKADSLTIEEALFNLNSHSDSDSNRYILGLVYLSSYKENLAEKVMNEIKSSSFFLAKKWIQAEVFCRRHQLKESERLLNEIIAQNPEFYPALLTFSYVKYLMMDFSASAELAWRVVRLGQDKVDLSNLVRAYCLYAGAKGMLAHYGGPLGKIRHGTVVLPTLKKAQRLQPDSVAVLFGLGSFYLLAPSYAGGDLQKAEQFLKKAAEKEPLFVNIYPRLAQVYQAKGDLAKYEFFLNKALQLDPKNEFALDIKNGRCKFICVRDLER